MSKVFLPQIPSRFDSPSRLWVPTLDVSPAKRFGELVVLLPPESSRLGDSIALLTLIRERLSKATSDDYLCCVGDPGLIGFCAIAMFEATRGPVRLLKWDRFEREYLVLNYV